MVFAGRRMTGWSRADSGNQKEEPGLRSTVPCAATLKTAGNQFVFRHTRPLAPPASTEALFLFQIGTAENAPRIVDVTERSCTGRAGRPPSEHAPGSAPARWPQGSMRKAKSLSE